MLCAEEKSRCHFPVGNAFRNTRTNTNGSLMSFRLFLRGINSCCLRVDGESSATAGVIVQQQQPPGRRDELGTCVSGTNAILTGFFFWRTGNNTMVIMIINHPLIRYYFAENPYIAAQTERKAISTNTRVHAKNKQFRCFTATVGQIARTAWKWVMRIGRGRGQSLDWHGRSPF